MHFPKAICTSVNDVIAHGVPCDYEIQDGDVVNLDITCYLDGFFGDNSAMFINGDVHPEVLNLSKIARESMFAGIQICRPGIQFCEIGRSIE